MFVAEYIDRHTHIEFKFSDDNLWVMALDNDGKLWCNHFANQFHHPLTKIEPITLPCPYCNATLNQSERVECNCGLVMEAITEKQFQIIMGAAQELIELGSKQYLLPRYVNEIHWLEITPGKEQAE